MDYYRELEAKIEQRKDRFTVEICIQVKTKNEHQALYISIQYFVFN